MRNLHPLALLLAGALVLSLAPPAGARSRKGDKLLQQGKAAEARKDYDKALELYEQALLEEPTHAAYILAVRRVRFQAGQLHVDKGQQLRNQGQVEEALAEFQKAFAIDPSSSIAEQEIRRTRETLRRLKQEAEKPGPKAEVPPEQRSMTAAELAAQKAQEQIARLLPPQELKPINPQISTLKMNGQPAKVLYETVGKLTGINVVFDPDFQPTPPGKNFNLDLVNVTLEQALEYLAVLTKTYWKPLSSNTIFVTNDNVTKRRDYEEFVFKVFYLKNVTQTQELNEISTAVRTLADVRRLMIYNAQNAIAIRESADKVALAEKIIQDLDKPKPEVVIDILVMEVNRVKSRTLTSSILSGGKDGINIPVGFTPRNPILSGTDSSSSSSSSSSTTSSSSAISLAQIAKVSTNDFSLTLPGATFAAVMSDRSTRILQSPQVRAADGQKATLKIGDRYPYATGSFQPGYGTVGVSPLVSTQFQFAEVGVNVDITPRIHLSGEVSMHVELEISAVNDRIDVGGLSQPVIGQRRVIHDLRIREGEISLLGGLSKLEGSKTMGGIPGLSTIPVLGRLFSSGVNDNNESDLLFALIPHIVRTSDINEINLRPVSTGNDATVKLSYAPQPSRETPAPAKPSAAPAPAAPAAPEAPKPAAPEPPKPAAPEAAQPAEPGALSMVLQPTAAEAAVGEPFAVTLVVNNATDLFTAPMRLRFDPKLVKLEEVAQGDFLGPAGSIVFTRNILSEAGEATVYMNRLPGSGGVTGSGALLTMLFRPLAPGAASISVAEVSLRNSTMQPLTGAPPKLTVHIRKP